MIIRLSERELKTRYGVFKEVLYYDGQRESIALVMGDIAGKAGVLCRVHSHCISAHIFNSVECTCREEMAAAQAAIEQAGSGLVIWLDQEGKGNGHLALIESIPYKAAGHTQAEAYKMAGFEADARSFRPAAEILADLGVESITLLSSSEGKAESLRDAGIVVAGVQDLGKLT